MISTNEFRSGSVIQWNGELYQILSYQHVKMQQRAPIVKTRLMRLKSGSIIEHSFRAGDKFNNVFLERKEMQFLYRDGAIFHFMDTSDYHDIAINEKMIGDKTKFLKENDTIKGVYCDNAIITIELPPSVTLKVTETEPGLRGDTAKGGTKPATVETGAKVKVPLFVNLGDVIKVDTRTGEYLARG